MLTPWLYGPLKALPSFAKYAHFHMASIIRLFNIWFDKMMDYFFDVILTVHRH